MDKSSPKLVTSQDIHGQHYAVPVDQLSWRPAVYAIIIRDARLLVVQEQGAYHLPGGGVDVGEMPEAAVVREVKEETGLAATNPRLVDARSTFFTSATGRQKIRCTFNHCYSTISAIRPAVISHSLGSWMTKKPTV